MTEAILDTDQICWLQAFTDPVTISNTTRINWQIRLFQGFQLNTNMHANNYINTHTHKQTKPKKEKKRVILCIQVKVCHMIEQKILLRGRGHELPSNTVLLSSPV